jgi:hypothetical protein
MYYLVIKNLGVERCIDINGSDIWKSLRYYDCRKNLEFSKGRVVRRIFIRCVQKPESRMLATIWHDPD